MDHVQQILLQQLQGQTGGPVITQRPQRNTSHDSSNSEGSKDSVSELALKARQWAEEQKRKKAFEEEHGKNDPDGLQGWKDEHPSWFQPQSQPQTQQKPKFQNPQNRGPAGGYFPPHNPSLPSRLQGNGGMPAFAPQPPHSAKKQRKPRFTPNRGHQRFPNPHQEVHHRKGTVGTFPDFVENDNSKNLPKWMRDEIERIQSQKQDENNDEVDESNISELQKLVDEDSEAESSEDDWKVEGRKLSEDQTKGKESDPELSDVEEKEDHLLDDEEKDMIKTKLMGSTLTSIFLAVTNELIGKISRNVVTKASSDQNETNQTNNALGGLIGYGSDDSDSEEESVEKSEVGSEGESDSSLSSEQIRRKRKVFDRKQKRRLDKLLRTNRGSGDDMSDESEAPSQSSSRYSSPAGRGSPSHSSRSKRKRSRSRKRSKSKSKSRRRERSRDSRERGHKSRDRSRSRSRRSHSHSRSKSKRERKSRSREKKSRKKSSRNRSGSR